MKEPKNFHRLKTSNAIIIVLASGACISPYKNRLYTVLKDAVLRKNACTSVSLPRTEDKKTQAGSEHNE